MFERCQRNGYIYKGSYTGAYCVSEEAYVNDVQPGEPCPTCGAPTQTVTEENYFFKLSAFQKPLLDLYERNPEFVKPDHRRNEMIAFVQQGLNDLSITRTNIQWGIPAPVEGHHVFYVWFDALISYMSAVKDDDLWPADLHLIGKDILRFHAIYWPAFLMAADLPLPKQIFAHGWILHEENKMSKSRGNVVRPGPIVDVVGADALRYFLLREITFGQDGSFSYDALIQRYNADLANGLGNLASRTLTMIHQYRHGRIPDSPGVARHRGSRAPDHGNGDGCVSRVQFLARPGNIVGLHFGDRQIHRRARALEAGQRQLGFSQKLLDETLYSAAEALRILCAWTYPVMPNSARNIWIQLGMNAAHRVGNVRGSALGQVASRTKDRLGGRRVPALGRERHRQDGGAGSAGKGAAGRAVRCRPSAAAGTAPPADAAKISIDDFVKVDLRVGQVVSAERVKGADKLLHLKVDIGEEQPRTIVAGIAESYPPEEMVGRKVVIVANLQPRKLRGIESNGMIVAASLEGGKPVLAGFLEDVPVGARAQVSLVDSHCHLDSAEFNDDREAVIDRALAAGVEHMMAIGTGERAARSRSRRSPGR